MAKETSRPDKIREYKRLALALVALFIILGGFLTYNAWPLLTGTTIILSTTPVDPFDPFRGQYMRINYEISNVPTVPEVEQGDTVYVLLAPDENNTWQYQSASLTKPKGVFIEGKVQRTSGQTIWITYGIEQFFFEIRADVPTRNITVEAKVSSGGRARIVNLLQNGKPVDIKYKSVSLTS